MEPLEGSVVTKENQKTEKNEDIKDNGTSGCGFSQLQQMKIDAIEGDLIKE